MPDQPARLETRRLITDSRDVTELPSLITVEAEAAQDDETDDAPPAPTPEELFDGIARLLAEVDDAFASDRWAIRWISRPDPRTDTEQVTGSIPVPPTMSSRVRCQLQDSGMASLIICPRLVRAVRRHLASSNGATSEDCAADQKYPTGSDGDWRRLEVLVQLTVRRAAVDLCRRSAVIRRQVRARGGRDRGLQPTVG
jgi:hypothetical protein